MCPGLGPFARLRSVRPGEIIRVTDARGTPRRYVVQRVQQISKKRVPLDRVFDRTGAPRLYVITCGGSFRRSSGYTSNVIVTAVPINQR